NSRSSAPGRAMKRCWPGRRRGTGSRGVGMRGHRAMGVRKFKRLAALGFLTALALFSYAAAAGPFPPLTQEASGWALVSESADKGGDGHRTYADANGSAFE